MDTEDVVEAEIVDDGTIPGSGDYAAGLALAVRTQQGEVDAARYGTPEWARQMQRARGDAYRSNLTEEEAAAHAAAEADHLARTAEDRKANTARGLTQAERTWSRFLASAGSGLPSRSADGVALARYARWLATEGQADGTPYAIETAKNRYGLTTLWLRSVGGAVDMDRSREALDAMYAAHDALQRGQGEGRGQAPAVTWSGLDRALSTCDTATLTGARNHALMLVSWSIMARSQEVAGLTWGDAVPFTSDDDGQSYITLSVRSGKTKASVRSNAFAGDVAESVARYRSMLAAAGGDVTEHAPVFVGVTKHGHPRRTALATKSVSDVTTAACEAAGLGKRYTSHSIRSGGATDMLANGYTVIEVARIGGWNPGSAELARYLRDAENLADRASVRRSRRLPALGT